MNKKVVVAVVVAVVALLSTLVYSSLHIANYRVEVCVAYAGRTECRTASADSEDHAMRSAQSNACALIASGVTDTMQCEHSNPTSVKWLKTK